MRRVYAHEVPSIWFWSVCVSRLTEIAGNQLSAWGIERNSSVSFERVGKDACIVDTSSWVPTWGDFAERSCARNAISSRRCERSANCAFITERTCWTVNVYWAGWSYLIIADTDTIDAVSFVASVSKSCIAEVSSWNVQSWLRSGRCWNVLAVRTSNQRSWEGRACIVAELTSGTGINIDGRFSKVYGSNTLSLVELTASKDIALLSAHAGYYS